MTIPEGRIHMVVSGEYRDKLALLTTANDTFTSLQLNLRRFKVCNKSVYI